MDCHRPHASPGESLLVTAGRAVLCFECHDDPSHKSDGSEWTFRHPPAEEDCGGCHVPHGSDEKGNLKKPQWDLCRSCHRTHEAHSLEASSADESGTVQIPEGIPLTEDGMLVCTTCHGPHGGSFPSLLKDDRSKLCVLCH
jgi:predicted CXXCH cytochrome family protein